MNSDMTAFFSNERNNQLDELMELLRIPSISSSTENKPDMQRAADWLANNLKKSGLENVQILPTAGHPVVYADWLHAPGKPTALIYGHYDVQPVEPLDAWETPPFEPTIRDGKLYARGATDDKAQFFMHIKTVEAFLRTHGSLPVNVKFCLEGEEEIASPNLPAFLETHAELLQADVIVISDGPMHDKDVPSVCIGLRGLSGFQLDAKGPCSDLHSGLFGGGVVNPVTTLVELLASMHDEQGHITIEGFYDKVNPLTEADREANLKLNHNEEQVRRDLEVAELNGEAGYTFLERTTARPTLEINGIAGGHYGEGLKPIVPSSAVAKVSCRLVDRQDPDEIMDLIEQYIERRTPAGVTITMKRTNRGKPFYISPKEPFIQAAAKAFEIGFGKPPVYIRSGGSIPIIEVFSRVLGAPVVMMDLGLPTENLHAPNEHYHLENFDKGIVTLCAYWEQLGSMNE